MSESPLLKAKSSTLMDSQVDSELPPRAPATSKEMARKQVIQLLMEVLSPISVDVVFATAESRRQEKNDKTGPPVGTVAGGECSKWEKSADGYKLLLSLGSVARATVKVYTHSDEVAEAKYQDLLDTLSGPVALILSNGVFSEEISSQQKQVEVDELVLEENHNYFSILYANAPLPYISLDGRNAITAVNRAWLSLMGYSQKEVIGSPFEKFWAKSARKRYRTNGQLFKLVGEIKELELELVKKDSTEILVQLDGLVVGDDGGNITSSHFSFFDVSGQSRIKDLIMQSEKLSSIAGLAAGIAHEINTPLSGILQSVQLIEMFLDPQNKNNAQLAKEEGVDLEKLQAYLQVQDLDYFIEGIRGSAIKASKIIRSLLDFSRPTKAKFEPVRLVEIIELVLRLVNSDYDLKKKYDVINTRFETEFDGNVPFINCVPEEIEQVILNIVKNSVYALSKAKTSNPKISIKTLLVDDKVLIEIQDNGPGIAPEVQKLVFNPFYSTKKDGEGTGLGLSVSHTFVTEKHKGAIWIESEPSAGTTVFIELPINMPKNT